MQSPELLEQTASERLTLDQEYEMQQSWFLDENSMSVAIIETRLYIVHLSWTYEVVLLERK